jgi:hypothetical protein
MNAMLAYEPIWLQMSGQLAFLGNRQESDPVQVYVWEPQSGKLARATAVPAMRHSLTLWHSQLAYVQKDEAAVGVDASPLTKDQLENVQMPGPDRLMIQEYGKLEGRQLFSGHILPGSVAWAPDGKRIAFVTLDGLGNNRLALVDVASGAVSLIHLEQGYSITGLVGWTTPRDVLLRARQRDGGMERLLQVGRSGVLPMPAGRDPKLSPDGRWLLVKGNQEGGVYLRTLYGAGRLLHPTATAYAWAPNGANVYVAVDREILELDLIGKVIRRWPHVAELGVGQLTVSPDDRFLAFGADFQLSAIRLR